MKPWSLKLWCVDCGKGALVYEALLFEAVGPLPLVLRSMPPTGQTDATGPVLGLDDCPIAKKKFAFLSCVWFFLGECGLQRGHV